MVCDVCHLEIDDNTVMRIILYADYSNEDLCEIREAMGPCEYERPPTSEELRHLFSSQRYHFCHTCKTKWVKPAIENLVQNIVMFDRNQPAEQKGR